jgi:hypothetical protein
MRRRKPPKESATTGAQMMPYGTGEEDRPMGTASGSWGAWLGVWARRVFLIYFGLLLTLFYAKDLVDFLLRHLGTIAIVVGVLASIGFIGSWWERWETLNYLRKHPPRDIDIAFNALSPVLKQLEKRNIPPVLVARALVVYAVYIGCRGERGDREALIESMFGQLDDIETTSQQAKYFS